MPAETIPLPSLFADPAPGAPTLDIQTYSYDERRSVFPAITHALDICGCWLLDRRPISFTQIEFYFELPIRASVELYAALLAAGLELSRSSHDDLTLLCLLRQHSNYPSSLPGIATVRLEVTFLEEGSVAPTTHAVTHS